MTSPVLIPFDADAFLDWLTISEAIHKGHLLPRAQITDSVLKRNTDSMLVRTAWIDGIGQAVKAATVFPNNKDEPTVNGGVLLFDDKNGTLQAIVDFHLVTKWKTVADSLLAATLLARKDSQNLLIVGAGTVASNLIDAYRTLFPNISVNIWNRNAQRGLVLAEQKNANFVNRLDQAANNADIIACATMSTDPILKGAWITPGTHIDLIGAYRADMREADDALMKQACIFVDNKDTTIAHIGELIEPIENGTINPSDVIADYYDIQAGKFKRYSDNEITVFKNGGGAHLDLMVCNAILKVWNAQA